MATNTTNYNLKKPDTTDPVSIADINGNMDTIDAQIKANADLIATMVPLAGGTMTGNLTVGSASIQTNGYVIGTWLRTTGSIHLGSTPADYPVLSGGWIYSRTKAETKADLGVDDKQDKLVAGTGITIADDGVTINHSNSVTSQTSYIGSATAVPRLKFDAQGHITEVTTATIYPPTTPGTAGQVWTSDGADAGKWSDIEVDLAFDESTNALTVTVNGTSRTVTLYSSAEGGSY